MGNTGSDLVAISNCAESGWYTLKYIDTSYYTRWYYRIGSALLMDNTTIRLDHFTIWPGCPTIWPGCIALMEEPLPQ
jgi:hypothetical protein